MQVEKRTVVPGRLLGTAIVDDAGAAACETAVHSAGKRLGRRERPRPAATASAATRYHDSLPWQELEQVRAVALQPVLAMTSLTLLMCVAVLTVVEL